MGVKNISGVRKVVRSGVARWVLDFRYFDTNGVRQRHRRDASVQTYAAACAEARRLMARAMETGSVESEVAEEKPRAPTLRRFYEDTFLTEFITRFRPATRERYQDLAGQGLLDELGDRPIDEIDAADDRRFAAFLDKRRILGRGPRGFLRTLLRAAIEAKHVDAMPKLPPLPRPSRKLPDAPTDAEVNATLEVATGWLRVAVALAAFAGLRMGEVRALTVRDVDLEGGRILVRHAMSCDEILTPKSGHERIVPLLPELRAILVEAMRSKLPHARIVVCNGETPRRQHVLARLKALQRKHGLPARSFHAFRHAFCSALVRRGASLEAIRLLAGHSDLATTQRYVHADAADLRGAIAKLAR